MNCCFVPKAVAEFKGVMFSAARAAALTDKVVELVAVLETAVIEVEPAATPVAKPVLLIDAINGLEELHVAKVVISALLLSL